MAGSDSVLDADAMARARVLLAPQRRPEQMWPVLTAAAVLAASALAFATSMVLAPPLVTYPAAQSAPG